MLYWANLNLFDERLPKESTGLDQYRKLEFRWFKRTQ